MQRIFKGKRQTVFGVRIRCIFYGCLASEVSLAKTTGLMPPVALPAAAEATPMICIDDTLHGVVEIRATGDVVLDVTFENTNACTKSIPTDLLQKLRNSKSPLPSPRVYYRVRLETLKKNSKYFTHLLGSDVFGEGRAIQSTFAGLAELNLKPSECEPDLLPMIKVVDEDDATRTLGRENVFRDMLRIIHGAEHLTKPITMTYLSVLVVMADRFDCLGPVARYITGSFGIFKYPQTLDRNVEELLRQKILIFYHTNQAARLATATKELILRGSSRWSGYEDDGIFSAAWWDLPDLLEVELAHRRACILRTISSLQMHFIELFTSRNLQCTLGYDSSPACDSFQLGEMIKFMTKKGLLSLIPFQAVTPEDPDYVWPEAYTGDIDQLIQLLRQCPEYQIDKNHSHCGVRVKILPALRYIKDCTDTGIGIKVMSWRTDRAVQSWISSKPGNGKGKKPFVLAGEIDGEKGSFFDFTNVGSVELMANAFGTDKAARTLFTADRRKWTLEKGEESTRLKSSLRF